MQGQRRGGGRRKGAQELQVHLHHLLLLRCVAAAGNIPEIFSLLLVFIRLYGYAIPLGFANGFVALQFITLAGQHLLPTPSLRVIVGRALLALCCLHRCSKVAGKLQGSRHVAGAQLAERPARRAASPCQAAQQACGQSDVAAAVPQ